LYSSLSCPKPSDLVAVTFSHLFFEQEGSEVSEMGLENALHIRDLPIVKPSIYSRRKYPGFCTIFAKYMLGLLHR
jgi:hypothetical protein